MHASQSILTKEEVQKMYLQAWKQQKDFPAIFQHEEFSVVQNDNRGCTLGCLIPRLN